MAGPAATHSRAAETLRGTSRAAASAVLALRALEAAVRPWLGAWRFRLREARPREVAVAYLHAGMQLARGWRLYARALAAASFVVLALGVVVARDALGPPWREGAHATRAAARRVAARRPLAGGTPLRPLVAHSGVVAASVVAGIAIALFLR